MGLRVCWRFDTALEGTSVSRRKATHLSTHGQTADVGFKARLSNRYSGVISRNASFQKSRRHICTK